MRRRSPRRALVALFVAPLMALGACAEEAPSDASTEAFCAAFNSLGDAGTGEDFRDFADRLESVGTPGDISGDARDGFKVVIRVARSLKEDATLDELVDPAVSNAEAQHLQVFIDYSSETCSALDGEAGAP